MNESEISHWGVDCVEVERSGSDDWAATFIAKNAVHWVDGVVRLVDDRVQVTDLNIMASPFRAHPESTPTINWETLRDIPIGTITQGVLKKLKDRPEADALARAWGLLTPDSSLNETIAETVNVAKSGPGRPPLDDEFLRRFALRRIEISDEDTKRPASERRRKGVNFRLSKEFSVSEATINSRLRLARKRGFLAPGTRGSDQVRAGPRLNNNATHSN